MNIFKNIASTEGWTVILFLLKYWNEIIGMICIYTAKNVEKILPFSSKVGNFFQDGKFYSNLLKFSFWEKKQFMEKKTKFSQIFYQCSIMLFNVVILLPLAYVLDPFKFNNFDDWIVFDAWFCENFQAQKTLIFKRTKWKYWEASWKCSWYVKDGGMFMQG